MSFRQFRVCKLQLLVCAFLALFLCSVVTFASADNKTCQYSLIQDFSSTVGMMGVLNFSMPLTPENSSRMGLSNVLYRNQRFEWVRSEQEAYDRYRQYADQSVDLLLRPLFIVSQTPPWGEGGVFVDVSRLSGVEVLSFEVDQPGAAVQLKKYHFSDLLRGGFKDAAWSVVPGKLGDGVPLLFADHLLVSPLQRGVIYLEDWIKSDTINKKLKRQARAKELEGFRFEINQHTEEALNCLLHQPRKGQADVENRYRNPLVMAEARGRLADGTMIEVSMVDAGGSVWAGGLFSLNGSVLSPETLYYSRVNADGVVEETQIDFAKMVVMVAGIIAQKEGVHFLDVQRLSGASIAMKGRYVSRAQFYEEVSKLPEKVNWSFPKIFSFTDLNK